MSEAEVVIAGGGPAGAAAAIVLAGAGRRILLVDSGAPAGPSVGEALPPAARPLLRDLGVLPRVEGGEHLRCVGNVSVWGGPQPAARDFLRDPHGPGWHLDRARFDASLRAAAAAAGAEVVDRARVTEGTPDAGGATDGGWSVRIRTGDGGTREVRCRWLIDAGGRGGSLARRLGARRHRDDRLVAFVAHFRQAPAAAGDIDDRTSIEAAPDGWWYTARVPGGERVVAFHTDADLAGRAAPRTAAALIERLQRAPALTAFLARHGYRPSGGCRAVDAGSAALAPFVGDGWLAVGDAALAFDPLSSQGLLDALYTGLRGGQAIDRALGSDAAAPSAYAERLAAIRRAYLAHRAAYYSQERRWPEAPFWRRRHALHAAAA